MRAGEGDGARWALPRLGGGSSGGTTQGRGLAEHHHGGVGDAGREHVGEGRGLVCHRCRRHRRSSRAPVRIGEGDSPLDLGPHLCAPEATKELAHRRCRNQGRSPHVAIEDKGGGSPAGEDRGWGSSLDQGLGLHQHPSEGGKDLAWPVRGGRALPCRVRTSRPLLSS